MHHKWSPQLGAIYHAETNSTTFRVWSPKSKAVELLLLAPEEQTLPMQRDERGYFSTTVGGVGPGARYRYRLDGDKERPDPASRAQPEGVHGPSAVVGREHTWDEGAWFGLPLSQYVIYELHVGTFTAEGTFDAAIGQLDQLVELGVTAVELMPLAQFPGSRNWGYDGVYLFAVQDSYGGPDGLKRFVEACHTRGLAVVLDVVYNHLGPEGNYLWDYGPYFTDRYRSPWGSAVNFDGAGSDEVRTFFIENALMWFHEFHIDALRLDAVHAMIDFTPIPFIEELASTVHAQRAHLNRRTFLIAESDANAARLLRPVEIGGYGLDAQWNDDFHHILHVLLTGERLGYYVSYSKLADLVKSLREGYVYTGQYSEFRGRRQGSATAGVPFERFVVFAQNHDHVGNRMLGDRLIHQAGYERARLAAVLPILSPFVPLIFMGEEYGETAPFLYFISHGDKDLVEAVRKGRAEEFAAFIAEGTPPDPQGEETFERSKLSHELRHQGRHARLRALYKELLRLRREVPALALLSRENLEVIGYEREKVLFMHRWAEGSDAVLIVNFSEQPATLNLPVPEGRWQVALDTTDQAWDEQAAATAAPPARPIVSDGQIEHTAAALSALVLVR